MRTVASMSPSWLRRMRSWSSEGDRLEVVEDVVAQRRLGLLVALARRVVAQLEEPDELGRDVRVGGDDVVLVALGEARADALAVAAVGAQDRDPPPVEAGVDDQAVQRVRLRLAAPDRGDALRDALAALARGRAAGRWARARRSPAATARRRRRAAASGAPRPRAGRGAPASAWPGESSTLAPTRYIPMRVSPSGSLRSPTWKASPPVNSRSKHSTSSRRGRRVDGRLVGVGQPRGPALGQHAPALVAVARDELLARRGRPTCARARGPRPRRRGARARAGRPGRGGR